MMFNDDDYLVFTGSDLQSATANFQRELQTITISMSNGLVHMKDYVKWLEVHGRSADAKKLRAKYVSMLRAIQQISADTAETLLEEQQAPCRRRKDK